MVAAYVILAFATALNFFLVFILWCWARKAQSTILATAKAFEEVTEAGKDGILKIAELAKRTNERVRHLEEKTRWLTDAATDDHK